MILQLISDGQPIPDGLCSLTGLDVSPKVLALAVGSVKPQLCPAKCQAKQGLSRALAAGCKSRGGSRSRYEASSLAGQAGTRQVRKTSEGGREKETLGRKAGRGRQGGWKGERNMKEKGRKREAGEEGGREDWAWTEGQVKRRFMLKVSVLRLL